MDENDELVGLLVTARDVAMAQRRFAVAAMLSYVLGSMHESMTTEMALTMYSRISFLLEDKKKREREIGVMVNEALKDVKWT